MAEEIQTATEPGGQEEGSGNISEADLIQRLTEKYSVKPEGEVVEQNNSEESESSTETIEDESEQSLEEEVDGEEAISSTENEEESLEEESDKAEDNSVLSQLGIETDGLSPEQIAQIKDALDKDKMVKRFGKLTAQKKEAQEKLEALQKESEPREEVVTSDLDSPVADILDPDELDKQSSQIDQLLDWAVEGLYGEIQYDDDGNEYLAEKDGKKYSRDQLKTIRDNAKAALGKDGFIAKQKKFINQRNQSDALAIQTFDFFQEDKSDTEEFKMWQALSNDPHMGKVFKQLPNANYLIGMIIEGDRAMKARANATEKPVAKKAAPKKAPVAPVPASGAAEPKSNNTNAALKKQIEAATKRYSESGNINDRQMLSELRAKLKYSK